MKILHVPYTFAPDAMGGTEYYVQALAQQGRALGYEVAIAAAGACDSVYQIDGIDVYRFSSAAPADAAYGAEDQVAAESFQSIVSRTRPDIVHLHAYSSAASARLLAAAKSASAATVFTYHTPTVSCFRGTMMAFGKMPCDGVLLPQRCTACTLEAQGVGSGLAEVGSRIPAPIGRFAGYLGLRRKHWLGVRMRALVEDGQARFRSLMASADHVVAVCDWVGDVLRSNGVSEAKLSVIRQGLIQSPTSRQLKAPEKLNESGLRLAYFGRLDSTKGVDTLIKAILALPELPVKLAIFGITQVGSEAFTQNLRQLAADDHRIEFLPPVKGPEVVQKMAQFDAVCVPSTWLETGPLVVYEAFGAGVPVLGSRLGGIQELVTHNLDGLLIEPGNARAWAEAIAYLAEQPKLLPQLASNIKAPRSMFHVAQDMHNIYQRLRPNSRSHS